MYLFELKSATQPKLEPKLEQHYSKQQKPPELMPKSTASALELIKD